MEAHNILVPYDGSAFAKISIMRAAEFVEAVEGSKLTAVYVTPVPGMLDFISDPEEYKARAQAAADERAASLVEEIKAMDELSSIDIDIVVLPGRNIAKTLLKYIEENDFDMVILGSHSQGTMSRMLGSVSYALVQNSTVPVLVMR